MDDYKKLRLLKNYKYFIILPDDPFKTRWDLFIAMLLIFTSISTPYRIAYYDVDELSWVIIDSLVDFSFAIDIVLNFFMAFYDSSDDIVDKRSTIACNYLRFWFYIDVVSIIPFNQILQTSDYSSLVRIARLPKLYRLFKIFKIFRLMKVVRERNNLIKYVNDLFRLNAGFERFIFFIILSLIFCHISSCFWVMISSFDGNSPDTWMVRNGYNDLPNYAIYTASLYFILTTILTVGFGDIYGRTQNERIFCIAMMAIGVFAFSFSISSLSSILTSIDARKSHLKKKMAILN